MLTRKVCGFFHYQQKYPTFPERQTKPTKALFSQDREADGVAGPICQHCNFCVEGDVFHFRASWQHSKGNLGLKHSSERRSICIFATSYNTGLIHIKFTLVEVLSNASSCSICIAMLPTLLPQLK